MNKLNLLGILMMLLASCSTDHQLEKPLFNMKECTTPEKGEIKLSNLFKRYRLVPLETNDSSLIGGRGNKVIQRNSFFYIQSEHSIVCFDADGHFIHRLDKYGMGPEDYTDISDFDVVSAGEGGQELWIAGAGGIQIYDAANGKHRRKITFPTSIHQFKYVNDHTILIITPDEEVFHVCNADGSIRKSFMKKDLANSVHKSCQFFEWQGKIAYQWGDTQTAIVYNPQTDGCSVQPIVIPENCILTPEISRQYYEKYGYLEQYDQMTKDYTLLLAIRTSPHKAAFTWTASNEQRLFTLLSENQCQTYAFSNITNDIFTSPHNLFLATLIGCESDAPSRLLFIIPSQQISNEEDNFWLLEAEF